MHVPVRKALVTAKTLQRQQQLHFDSGRNPCLVASTGVIGKQIPIDKMAAGVEMLAPKKLSERWKPEATAAKAIMTTDTNEKEVAVQIEVGGKTVTIGSMCKGSGMIHPNMCTMLAFVTTDAIFQKRCCRKR